MTFEDWVGIAEKRQCMLQCQGNYYSISELSVSCAVLEQQLGQYQQLQLELEKSEREEGIVPSDDPSQSTVTVFDEVH
jgi:hypothetical protein